MMSSVQVLQGLRGSTVFAHSLYHKGSGWQHECSLSSHVATVNHLLSPLQSAQDEDAHFSHQIY